MSTNYFHGDILGQVKSVCALSDSMYKLDLRPNRYSLDLDIAADQSENSSAIQGVSPLPPEKKQRSTTHADSVPVTTGMYRAGLKRICNTKQSLKVHTT